MGRVRKAAVGKQLTRVFANRQSDDADLQGHRARAHSNETVPQSSEDDRQRDNARARDHAAHALTGTDYARCAESVALRLDDNAHRIHPTPHALVERARRCKADRLHRFEHVLDRKANAQGQREHAQCCEDNARRDEADAQPVKADAHRNTADLLKRCVHGLP